MERLMEREILNRLGAFYACQIVRGERYYLLTAYIYQPFSDFPDYCIKIDAYYPASNKVYSICREFAGEIGGRIINNISYKRAAYCTGEFLWGRNDLLIHKQYGSYFVLNMIELAAPLDMPPAYYGDNVRVNCSECGLCLTACPGGAIDLRGFKRERCLRDMADRALCAESLALLGDSLLGCEICRDCCPYNEKILKTPPPEALIQLLDMERILIFDKQTRLELAGILGSNMARAPILLPAAIAGICRRGAWEYIPLVERLLGHASERVRTAAELGMERYNEARECV